MSSPCPTTKPAKTTKSPASIPKFLAACPTKPPAAVSLVRDYGQVHLEFDGERSLSDVHDVSDAVECLIREALPKAEVIIHQDSVKQ